MWNWFFCYLSGQHDYAVSCEPDAIFLQCRHCGRRSHGWELRATGTVEHAHAPARARRVS